MRKYGGDPLHARQFRTLPEYAHYADTGCEHSPACLSCPLPRCKYDEPQGQRPGSPASIRAHDIPILRRLGVPVDVIAEHYGISRRTVFHLSATSNHAPSLDVEPARQESRPTIPEPSPPETIIPDVPDWLLRGEHRP